MGLGNDPAEGPAADSKKLRPVVADSRAEPPRGHPAADAAGLVEQDHRAAGRHEFPRRAQPRDSGPDDNGI